MVIDPSRLVAFLHVVLFAYWLGADLGVLITSVVGNQRGVGAEARAKLREAGTLVDMAPRTCLVLMIPVGLTLATNYGSPITGPWLGLVWAIGLAWVGLVWMVHFKHGQALGDLLWKVDFGLRIAAMVAFLGFGAYCLVTGGPITATWLATKITLFGVLIFLGVMIRVLLLTSAAHAPPKPAEAAPAEYVPSPFWNPIRNTVFGIWALVFVMAFLGVVKPF